MKHPAAVTPANLLCWRDTLRTQRKSAATVSFKLSVVHSFFKHLRAAGAVALNPAATRLVPPREVLSQPAGRALTPKEVRYLLAGLDRKKPEGARDYWLMLMLVMLRLSLRVSEEGGGKRSATAQGHEGSYRRVPAAKPASVGRPRTRAGMTRTSSSRM